MDRVIVESTVRSFVDIADVAVVLVYDMVLGQIDITELVAVEGSVASIEAREVEGVVSPPGSRVVDEDGGVGRVVIVREESSVGWCWVEPASIDVDAHVEDVSGAFDESAVGLVTEERLNAEWQLDAVVGQVGVDERGGGVGGGVGDVHYGGVEGEVSVETGGEVGSKVARRGEVQLVLGAEGLSEEGAVGHIGRVGEVELFEERTVSVGEVAVVDIDGGVIVYGHVGDELSFIEDRDIGGGSVVVDTGEVARVAVIGGIGSVGVQGVVAEEGSNAGAVWLADDEIVESGSDVD